MKTPILHRPPVVDCILLLIVSGSVCAKHEWNQNELPARMLGLSYYHEQAVRLSCTGQRLCGIEQHTPTSIIDLREATTAGAASSGSASIAVPAKGNVIMRELVETGERPD